jgi:hypothetical protein
VITLDLYDLYAGLALTGVFFALMAGICVSSKYDAAIEALIRGVKEGKR